MTIQRKIIIFINLILLCMVNKENLLDGLACDLKTELCIENNNNNNREKNEKKSVLVLYLCCLIKNEKRKNYALLLCRKCVIERRE